MQIKSNIKDIVTEYDKACQDRIVEIISQHHPDHSILGEESVAPGAAASEAALEEALENNSGFLWIIDSIDGTANFSSGLALSGVIVSVVWKDTTVIGVCYDPHQNEMFTAVKGQGAWMVKKDGTKEEMKVSNAVKDVKDAIVNAGCPAGVEAFEASMKGVVALNREVRRMYISCMD